MTGVSEVIRLLESSGWMLERVETYRVWCRKGCKIPIPRQLAAGKVHMFILRRGDSRIAILVPVL